jgi:three-Cys-motif partner protein
MVLPSYEDREQTAVKHKILQRYLSAFVPIVGDWARDIAYIDCMAGPWKSVDPQLKDTSFGHAVDELRRTREILKGRGKFPSIRCLLIENDPSAFAHLKEYCDRIADIEITPKKWDLTEHVQDVVKFVRERNGSFPFVFIDPTGWEQLELDLIRPVLSLSPGEVLINLMTSWITRFISVESKTRQFRADLWEAFGQISKAERRGTGRGGSGHLRQPGAHYRTI